MRDIHVSIVSHSQIDMVERLLIDLSGLGSANRMQVTITINVNESVSIDNGAYKFPIKTVINKAPRGFGSNHNQAFTNAPQESSRRYFVVMNPDIRIHQDVFSEMLAHVDKAEQCGVATCVVKNSAGELEDNARNLPTIIGLSRKLFMGHKGEYTEQDANDYVVTYPDWVAGMFMLFPVVVYRNMRGFDENYFLYYEDVDICCRLWLGGYSVLHVNTCNIVHDAQRDSRKKLKYMYWHLASIARFLLSNEYRRAKVFHKRRHGANKASR